MRFALMLVLLARPLAAAEGVRVWQEDVVLPTYPIGADDVNPHFYELDGSVIYPYTMQDALSTEKVDRTYRAWFLENEYLKLMCLPEIGGRVQFVLDKRRNEEMFYHNRVIRPGLIALRGAWVSGGIEWNRGPQGHTVTSFSPVDVVGVDNADGSATLVIGSIEMNFRTRWEVRLTLHPGRTFLDEEIALENPTDGFHPYYFWNNTAFPNRPGTRFIYPMTLASDHDGRNFFSWPEHEGRDLTWLVNYPEPTSVFAYRSVFDFFGAYDVDRDYGIVQVANHHELPGKKGWTWGQADSGLASQSVLTDDDGPYIEVQSGPLRTQADFATLAPGQEVRWREYWYPVFGLGDGFEYATKDVAVQRLEREGGIEFRFHPTGTFEGARIQVGSVERTVSLSPDATVSVPSPTVSAPVSVVHEGRTLLSYRSPLEIPVETPPPLEPADPPASRTAEEAYLVGRQFDLQMRRGEARAWYERALDHDAGHGSSLVALADLELQSGRVREAKRWLSMATARDPESGWAHYLTGVAALREGALEAALASGYQASKLAGMRALGLGVAGRALLRLGRTGEAVDVFRRAYASDGDRSRSFDALLIALEATGARDEAMELARSAVEAGTTRLVPHALVARARDGNLNALTAFVGEDAFALLELALAFDALGQRESARWVLGHAGLPDRPLPLYYLAYWSPKSEASTYLERAASLSHDYVFPSRPESLDVLEFATARAGDGNGKTHLALGNLLAGLGRMDEARVAWTEACRREPDLSVAHRNLAMLAWKRDGDLAGAAERFERAIAARPDDQTLYRDLGRLRLEQHRPKDAVALLTSMPAAGRRRADVTLLLARAYVADARYDDAIALLAHTTFSNREGDAGTWELFSRAHVERGRERMEGGSLAGALADFETALTYPENLNVGRPARPSEARALYWKGRALDALGRGEEAARALRECVSNEPLTEEQETFIARCRGVLEGR